MPSLAEIAESILEFAHEEARRGYDEKDERRIGWLLLEKRPRELKAYLCWGLDAASLEELVARARLRWTVEQFHREAKGILGLDEFEGRPWKGWHHHVTMVLLAYAYLRPAAGPTRRRSPAALPPDGRERGRPGDGHPDAPATAPPHEAPGQTNRADDAGGVHGMGGLNRGSNAKRSVRNDSACGRLLHEGRPLGMRTLQRRSVQCSVS